MDDRDITIGEVVRLLQRQDEQLALILAEAKKTNGNVIRHELRLDGLDREVRDLKRRPATTASATTTTTTTTAAADDNAAGITRRDIKVLGGALIAVEALLRIGPPLVKFLMGQP